MSDTKEQILSFLEKCEELKNCKFIMATTKIKDLLKSIVNCPELYRMFDAVTKDFNFSAAKKQCLITSDDGLLGNSYVVLPRTIGHRLAFIFCLLVEFDKNTINFNDFLRKYFPEDGSYFESYHAFCGCIIDGLQECVTAVFGEELHENLSLTEDSGADAHKAEILSALDVAFLQEIDFITNYALDAADKENGLKILSELKRSVKMNDEQLIDSLLCGYNYFVLYNKCISDGITEIIRLLEEFEKVI